MLSVTDVYLRACSHFPCIGQKVNQRSLNSHYIHEASASDHTWLSSDTAIWSLGPQAVSAVGQFPWIRMPLLFGRAIGVKSTFDQ